MERGNRLHASGRRERVQGLNGEKEVRRSGEGEGTGETWRRGGYG